MRAGWRKGLANWELTDVEIHKPVLLNEALEFLDVKRGGTYIDATMDGGGHTRGILKATGGKGTVIGIEMDGDMANAMRAQNFKNLIVEESNYIHMREIAKKYKAKAVDGILFDFGTSSWHLSSSGRGFSFLKDEPLDMRYSKRGRLTAAQIINSSSARELADIFYKYGEERNSRAIANEIVKARKTERVLSSKRLAEIICGANAGWKNKIHPATKVFQALRIKVNSELENIERGLNAAIGLVRGGGKVIAISFHSLEDRIVKNTFRSAGGILLTKKPVRASRCETLANPRARSAALRAWERI